MSKASQRKLSIRANGYKEGFKGIPLECYTSVKQSRRSEEFRIWSGGFKAGQQAFKSKQLADKKRKESPLVIGLDEL